MYRPSLKGYNAFVSDLHIKQKSPHLHPWNAVTLTYKRYIGQSCFIPNIKCHNYAISMLSLLLIVKHDFYIIIQLNGRTKSFLSLNISLQVKGSYTLLVAQNCDRVKLRLFNKYKRLICLWGKYNKYLLYLHYLM